jgi:hypothetical protein
MADYIRRDVTVTTREYVLTTPCFWDELNKALAAIVRDNQGNPAADFGDFVKVETCDEQIVLSYVLSTNGGA